MQSSHFEPDRLRTALKWLLFQRFPALRLAREALKAGGSAPTILNAANEEAVAGFLDRKTGFLDIPRIVSGALETVPASEISSVEDVFSIDSEARRVARELLAETRLEA